MSDLRLLILLLPAFFISGCSPHADFTIGGAKTNQPAGPIVPVPALGYSIQKLTTYDTPGSALKVVTGANVAYVSDDTGYMRILDTTDKVSVNQLNAIIPSAGGEIKSATFDGNFLYFAGGSSRRLYVSDISNPAAPAPVVAHYHDITASNTVFASAISGTYAYVVTGLGNTGDSRLYIWDISNRSVPVVKGSLILNDSGYSVAIKGTNAYIAAGTQGLVVIDIANPSLPSARATYNTPGIAYKVLINGNYAYVADDTAGVQIVDISNPALPTLVANYNTAGNAYDLAFDSGTLYVADGNNGIVLLDVSSAQSPKNLVTLATLATCRGVHVSGNFVYAASTSAGLEIFEKIPSGSVVAQPTFSVPAGSYQSNFSLVLSTSTPYATIKYTVDGSDPLSSGTALIYTNAINVNSTRSVRAIAYRAGFTNSGIASAQYDLGVSNLTINPATGTFSNATNITITTSTPGASIYYTIDGSDPATSGSKILYSGTFALSGVSTLKAVGIVSGYANSATQTGNYTFQVANPNSSPREGNYAGAITVYMSTTSSGATIRYTTDGSDPASSGTAQAYAGMFDITSARTFRMIAQKAGYLNSAAVTATLTPVGTTTGLGTVGTYSDAWSMKGIAATAIAVGTDNLPVIAFPQFQDIVVKKFVAGTTWTTIGTLTPSGTGDYFCLLIDPTDGKPVLIYKDLFGWFSANIVAKKWNSGTSWTDLAFPTSALSVYQALLAAATDSTGRPIVAYTDISGYLRVWKYDSGSTWVDLGTVMATSELGIVVPDDGRPIVAFKETATGKLRVMRWNSGTTWDDMGLTSAGTASGIRISVKSGENIPRVAYYDFGNSKTHVAAWSSGTTWVDLGSVSGAMSTGQSSLVQDSTGQPIMLLSMPWTSPGASVGKLWRWSSGNNWLDAGYVGLGATSYEAMAIDGNNKLYIIEKDSFGNPGSNLRALQVE